MFIKEIELNNFRIYKGSNKLTFLEDHKKNIYLVSGFNGFGKTTFLTSLVWCLYGKNMQDVDEFFRNKINDAGGYLKYLEASMNLLAKVENDSDYYVSLTLVDVDIPGITSNEIEIRRSFKIGAKHDIVAIKIDGYENELVLEIGNDIFINDFILPKEIAKFFFFDAEKITSIAEIKTIEEKRLLSRAYSEVLGIKKYEDLRSNLEDLRLRFRRDSASPQEVKKIVELEKDIHEIERVLGRKEERLNDLEEEKRFKREKSNELQEKLIREGSTITVEELNQLRKRKVVLEEEYQELKVSFKEILDLAPFAIAGSLFNDVEIQLLKEQERKTAHNFDQDYLKEVVTKINAQLTAIALEKSSTRDLLNAADSLMRKYLIKNSDGTSENELKVLHDFSDQQLNSFKAVAENLRTSYKSTLKDISGRMRRNKAEWFNIQNQISKAESKEKDLLIQNFRNDKAEVDREIDSIITLVSKIHHETGALQNELNIKKSKFSELQKKVQVNSDFQEKDTLADRLIVELSEFISKIKEEKRHKLEQRIKEGLNSIMHKRSFVESVEVNLEGDIMDIELYNQRGERITKEDLSMGEKQLYATAILKALVEESNIQFPVFIDSPMQKLDPTHAKNIITDFYPKISKQVVVLPLLGKELTKAEYAILQDKVKSAFIIHNVGEDESRLVEVKPDAIFNESNKLSNREVIENV